MPPKKCLPVDFGYSDGEKGAEGRKVPSREVTVVNKLGIHLRAAAAFVGIAQRFPCDVKVSASGQQSNGKSILSVLSLGVPRGSMVLIETAGEREEEALGELADFVSDRFGEPE